MWTLKCWKELADLQERSIAARQDVRDSVKLVVDVAAGQNEAAVFVVQDALAVEKMNKLTL